MTLKDGDSATDFTLGHEWEFRGSGIYQEGHAPGGEWHGDDMNVTVGDVEAGLTLDYSEDGTCAIVISAGDVVPGTYHDVPISFEVHRGGVMETLWFTLPTLVVNE